MSSTPVSQSVNPSEYRRSTAESDVLPRLTRLFKILTLVGSRQEGERLGRSVLAARCGASRRTIQRDISLLTDGELAPIEYDLSQRSYVLRARGWTFPITSWTAEDVLALALARSAMDAPTAHGDEIGRALDKVISPLSPALRGLLDDYSAILRSAPRPRGRDLEVMKELAMYAISKETVEINYESQSSGHSLRLLDPYELQEMQRRSWMVHGWCHKNQEVRSFSVDRIAAVRPTGAPFIRRETEWSLFAAAVGVIGGLRSADVIAVDVRFTPEVSRYVLRHLWPSSLQTTQEAGGSVRLTGVAAGTQGIVTELLRWRRHAHILGGPELMQATHEELRAMLTLYEDNNSPTDADDAGVTSSPEQ